jgi:hypothetical protein
MFYLKGCDRKSFELMMEDFRNRTLQHVVEGIKVETVRVEPFDGEAGEAFRSRDAGLTLSPKLVVVAEFTRGPEYPEELPAIRTLIPMGMEDGGWFLAAPR